MSFWGTSKTSPPHRRAGSDTIVWSLFLATALTTMATTSLAQGYPVEIVEAKENGADLEVRLLWLRDPDNPIPSILLLYGESGQEIAATAIETAPPQSAQAAAKPLKEAVADTSDPPPAEPEQPFTIDVVMEDALAMLPENHLNLLVEDAEKNPLSSKFPLVIKLGSGPGGCFPVVESRIETDAVLIEPELSRVLDGLEYENLDDALAALKLQMPDLQCAIESLQADLARLRSQISELDGSFAPAETCSYFWQGVIDGDLGSSGIYQGPYDPEYGPHIMTPGFTEVGGYTDRSAHCIQTRAVGKNESGVVFEQPYTVDNQLDVTFSTRRWTGSASECSTCAGTVRFDLAYSAKATAQVIEILPPTEPNQQPKGMAEPIAIARTSETAVFSTDSGQVFHLTVDANASTAPPLGDLDIALLTKGASAQALEQPSRARLAVTGSTLVNSNAEFMAQTEYQLDYFWWVYANSSCAALNDVSLLMSSIPLQLQPYTEAATQIKLQRYP